MKISPIKAELKLKVSISLWSAIKLRIAGLYNIAIKDLKNENN
jgi:hypothetical protein